MQLFSRNKALIALSLGALTALGACGDDVTVPVAPAAPVTISITPPSAVMNVGETLNFAVSIAGGNPSPTLASCSSSNAAVATASVSGSACSVRAVAPGNATITAASSSGQAAAAGVSVAAPAAAISGLAVSPAASQLSVGGSVTLVPTVNRAGSSVNVTYTYTSSAPSIATVTAAGVVTAVAPGSATITISAAGTGTGFSAATLTTAASITVADRTPSLTALQLQPASVSLTIGGTQAISAVASGPRASAATFTYTSATPAVATVSAAGVISAVAPGTATIRVSATAAESGAFAASTLEGLVTVTVSERTPGLTALQVAPSTSALTVGGTVTITNTLSGPRASTATITYGSSAPTVATVDAAGKVTAMAPGSAVITVTASSAESGAFAASSITGLVNVTVSERTAGLTGLQVSPASASVVVNGTQALTAVASGPQASAATISYGSSAPAVAIVSASGVILGIAPGSATITVTAQSVETGAFAASSISQLIAVTVSAPSQVSISLSDLKQGPSVTSYSGTGIVSGANAQVGQPIDRANVRDQIQVSAQLNPNGLPVDSVVVYVANADGTNRRAAARQTYSNGSAAAGTVTLFVNTAEFEVDFTAGTASVSYPNGQRQISVSAFSGATERQSANTETVNFNNVDGYAAQVTAPARSAVSAAGLTWYGGPGASGRGTATIVPVFYTKDRSIASATLQMRQGALGATTACLATEVDAAAPFRATFDSIATVVAADGNIECGGLESGDDNIVGVSAALDNAGNPAPITTYAAGFRTSSTVTAPSPMRLDYKAPTATPVNIERTAPAVTGWVNATYNFNTLTGVSTDLGVGFPGTTDAARKAARVWQWYGCGSGSATAPNTFTGLAGDLSECSTNTSTTAYSIRYTDVDMLSNIVTATAVTVGVDKTAPVGRWASSSPVADSVSNVAATLVPQFSDALSRFIDDAAAGTPATAAERATSGYIVRASNLLLDATNRPNSAGCYRLNGTTVSATNNNAGTSFLTAPSCTANTANNTLLSAADADGWQTATTYSPQADEITMMAITVTDRAGNSATLLSRRYLRDAAAPTEADVQAVNSVSTSSNPSFSIGFVDNVKVVAANLFFTYGVFNANPLLSTAIDLDGNVGQDRFVYPYQTLSTPFGTPLNASGTATLSVATPTPMVTSITTTVQGVANSYAKLNAVGVTVRDAFGANTSDTDDFGTTASANQTALTTGASFTVLGSLNAANGAGSGLKAQYNSGTADGINRFVRVDFFRRNGNDILEYLGSGTNAVQALDAANNQIFTWVIDSYANQPDSASAQRAAAAGDQIVALGVRSTGGAVASTMVAIGGPVIALTITGTEGNPGNVVISGPNGFSQTYTASGTYAMPTPGDYTVTQYPSILASGGRYFINTNAASGVIGTYTLVANGTAQAVTVPYLAQKFTLTYAAATGTTAWGSVPTAAFATLANATSGFSTSFNSATTGYLLPVVGSQYAVTTAAATAAATVDGVSNVLYNLTVSANATFTPGTGASATTTSTVTYTWARTVKVDYVCDLNGDGDALDADEGATTTAAGVWTGGCPIGLAGAYTIGRNASSTSTAFTAVKTATAKVSGVINPLAAHPTGATAPLDGTYRLLFPGAFATSSALMPDTAQVGWFSVTATADSVYGIQSAAVTPAVSTAPATITVTLTKARIALAAATFGATVFQPNVIITKVGDAACSTTLPAILSGAAAAADRVFNPTCGAGSYVISYQPTTLVSGVTVSPTALTQNVTKVIAGNAARPTTVTAATYQ